MIYSIMLGKCALRIELTYPQMLYFFKTFYLENCCSDEILSCDAYERNQYLEQFPEAGWDAYAEYKCLLNLASDAMMKHNQLLFHSAAILIGEKAWLLSGPSGVGKSTQYRNLKSLYPDDIEIISGDNPVLIFEKEGISVFPSPWNGKENWGSMKTGELAGIILLKQDTQNSIRAVSPEEAVIPVYEEINTYAKTEEQIHLIASLEEKLITSVPIWEFSNTGDADSSKMLYEHITGNQERRSG